MLEALGAKETGMPGPDPARPVVIDLTGLGRLVETLTAEGYRVIGPTVKDGAIVLSELDSAGQLPAGWGAETGPGFYRLHRREDGAVFGHSAGPQSWKQFLHPARRQLWSYDKESGFQAARADPPRYAFLGVRGCDLAAIRVLRGPLGGGAHRDGTFTRTAGSLFVIAVNCTEPGGVCFCASMGTGPAAGPGYDIALTEQTGEPGHRFVAEAGTAEGARILAVIPHRDPRPGEAESASSEVAGAAGRMGREMPAVDLPALIRGSRESPHWQDVASRCLTCGNCTMVCPTCFCTTTEDVTDLSGDHAERWQRWASCFELDFSYVHGGNVRDSGESRYRQWISHKLGTWHDQFGSSGCVGCGRCIAWCPVGIDITAEVASLAAADADQTATEDRHEPG
jgi:ferredoxin